MMLQAFRRLLPVIVLSVTLIGCSANHNSIYRLRSLDDGRTQVFTIDAKQRAILSAYRLLDKDGKPDSSSVRAFCSEPSPDVFSVIAQSLSAGGSFSKGADPTSIQLALNAAFSSSEQGSTIPRTQTINMLRELMFRTCERFLSGGYDPTELSLQAIRDQRLMVSILAIEQLTGAVTPKPVVISASGSGSAGITGEALVRLDDSRKARDKANADYESATADYEQANGTEKVCDAIAGKDEKDLTDAQKAKAKPCADAKTAKEKALADRTAKTAAYQELSTLAQSGGVSVSTSTAANAQGGLDQAPGQAIANVSATVGFIVEKNFNDTTETMMFCLRILRDQPKDKLAIRADQEDSLKSVCVRYLESGVNAAEKRLSGEIADSQNTFDKTTDSLFGRFWTPARAAAFQNADARIAFVRKLVTSLAPSDRSLAACFSTAVAEMDVRACFFALPAPAQIEVVDL